MKIVEPRMKMGYRTCLLVLNKDVDEKKNLSKSLMIDKNSQENVNKSNPAIYKKNITL